MALEMHHGKVSFLWDTGSGHTRLEYPDVQINNDKWHRINATRFVALSADGTFGFSSLNDGLWRLVLLWLCRRFGRHGTLTVQQTDSEPLPAVKTTASGSSTVMDVSRSTWVFVGGLGAQVKVRWRSGCCSSVFGPVYIPCVFPRNPQRWKWPTSEAALAKRRSTRTTSACGTTLRDRENAAAASWGETHRSPTLATIQCSMATV